jgi:hypothetical protein
MRRRGAYFWGSVLILLGLILLAQNMGWIRDAGGLIWPALLILAGAWILWGALGRRPGADVEQVVIPLEGARRARLRVRHGAGRLIIAGGAPANTLLSGSFAGGLDYRSRPEGDVLDVKLRGSEHGWYGPWAFPARGGFDWNFALNSDIELALDLRIGANGADLNLTDLRVTELNLELGASSTQLTLPAHAGFTRANLRLGAAALSLRAPAGVAVRLRVRAGLASINVDTARFPRQAGDTYQSPDYDTAANKIDIDVEAGLGSLDLR